MKPLIPLHDPRFHYTNAAQTDIRKTFQRVRAKLEAESEILRLSKEQDQCLAESQNPPFAGGSTYPRALRDEPNSF